MPPRLDPTRAMTGPERARKSRRDREAYVAALEAAVCDADCDWWDAEYDHAKAWRTAHAPTIARARAARRTAATTTED